MTPREVDLVRARLGDIAESAGALARAAEDLYRLSYEKAVVGDDVKVAGGSASADGTPAGLDTVGDARARALWHKLERHARSSELALRALLYGAGNLLAQGEVDDRIRFGSSLTPAEMDRLLTKQAERRGDPVNHYTPARTEEQPEHDGRRAEKQKRKGRRR